MNQKLNHKQDVVIIIIADAVFITVLLWSENIIHRSMPCCADARN